MPVETNASSQSMEGIAKLEPLALPSLPFLPAGVGPLQLWMRLGDEEQRPRRGDLIVVIEVLGMEDERERAGHASPSQGPIRSPRCSDPDL